jgi:hypothetical protein
MNKSQTTFNFLKSIINQEVILTLIYHLLTFSPLNLEKSMRASLVQQE